VTTATTPTPATAAPPRATPRLLRAAFVRRPHGVRGELRVEPLGGDARRFHAGLRIVAERDGTPYTVRTARDVVGGDVLVTLDEVRTRDAAESLRGGYLCVPAEARRGLGEREWFVWQLVGLAARTPDGVALGWVTDVEEYPEHEVLVVRNAEGRVQRFPMVSEFVAAVDLDGGAVTLTPWPEDDS
jgi:16S rRNA processing protein RimM